MNPRLYELAEKYSVDKLHFHSYIGMYCDIFDRLQASVNRLFEIGIGYEHLMAPLVPKYIHGASLRMWADFFPGAEIYGCDIRPETIFSDGPQIRTFVGDQSTIEGLAMFYRHIPDRVEVLIDDGSHVTEDQLITAAMLMPMVCRGGVYIVEDVKEPEKIAHAIGGEIMRGTKRNDDNLVVKFI